MAQAYSGRILEYTKYLILGLQTPFAVLINPFGAGGGSTTSLKQCTGRWLLAQTALQAVRSSNSHLRDNTGITHSNIPIGTNCNCNHKQ